MCGRYTLAEVEQALLDEFHLESVPAELIPRYNVAPTQPVAAITDRRPSHLVMLRWGLVPHWAKDPSIGARMINARVETAAEKPAFRDAFRERRALIPADGFFEWVRQGKQKQPMYFRPPSRRPFSFAGLWERWRQPSGEILFSCTILTGPPSETVAPIHDRMPLIVPPEAREAWLDGTLGEPTELVELAHRFSLDCVAVSRLVNSPFNDSPECLEPIESSGT